MASDITHVARLTLTAEAQATPHISDVALFLYDFTSLYEIVRLAVDPRYRSYHFSRFSLYRNGRPLEERDQLQVGSLRMRSPLEVVATIAVAGGAAASVATALWVVVQTVERIYNLPLNREKLELEVQKLRREEAQPALPLDMPGQKPDAQTQIARRKATDSLEAIARRLEASPVRIVRIELEVRESGAPAKASSRASPTS
ncbi:MAG TPA: hypothetical protein VJJ70_06910 [Anaerolineales bacterium]|nr:hypothetical protein [Anaerolineales bacterium]